MQANRQDNPEARKPHSNAGPSSVYHRQRPSPRSRHDPHEDSAPPRSADLTRGDNAAKQMLSHGIRRFIVVLVAMVGLLIWAVHYLNKNWQQAQKPRNRQQTVQFPPSDPQPAQNTTPTESRPLAPLLLESVTDLLSLSAHLDSPWTAYGHALLLRTNTAAARFAFDLAIAESEDPEAFAGLGMTTLAEGDPAAARRLLSISLTLDPDAASPHYGLSLAELAGGNVPMAHTHLDTYLGKRPQDLEALALKTGILVQQGRYPEAVSVIDQSIAVSPTDSDRYLQAAALCSMAGDLPRAAHYMERALPHADPSLVYRIYQGPTFRELRLSEHGAEFEKKLAAEVRRRFASERQTRPRSP